jgi:hypothetical protein
MPARGLANRSRAALGTIVRHYDRSARSSLDWDRLRVGKTPAKTKSQETRVWS